MAEIDAQSIARGWLSEFTTALSAADAEALSSLFVTYGYLRDVLVFTWDSRTLHGRTQIKEFLSDKLAKHQFHNVQLDTSSPYLSPAVDKSDPNRESVRAMFTFETENAICRGSVSLVADEGGTRSMNSWKALSVFTTVQDWKGHEEATREFNFQNANRTWAESNPTVLIVGAGQAGLQLAAQLHQSGIPCLIIEKEPRVGDNWRKRYPSLKLHVPRGYCRLLFQNYPSNYPTYIPKNLVADWLEAYVLSQNLHVWTSSIIDGHPTYDRTTRTWTVTVNKDNQRVTLKPKHLVMALGTFGDGVIPVIKGQDTFEGSQVHSSHFPGGAEYTDKRVLVIGAANSASDICMDLVNGGAKSVTLFQRSATCVHSSKYIHKLITALFPYEVPIEVTDFKMEAVPTKLLLESLRAQQCIVHEHDMGMLDGLRNAGFKLTDGPTGAGFVELGLTRGGGYLFDSGFASLISDGTIKLKNDVEIDHMSQRSVAFSDGSELDVDDIVYATGYHNIRETYKHILGEKVVEGTADVWDLDEEGEVRGVYRPTGYPRLWYIAGDFAYARRSSKRLALLIQADELGYYNP